MADELYLCGTHCLLAVLAEEGWGSALARPESSGRVWGFLNKVSEEKRSRDSGAVCPRGVLSRLVRVTVVTCPSSKLPGWNQLECH